MNYFELFELPLSYTISQKDLTTAYYALNRQWHPDRYTTAGPDKQSKAMEMSSRINEGYQTLKDTTKRLHHILQILHAAPQEGQEKMPQSFLMEMMDINEAIMDHKMDPSPESEKQITDMVGGMEAELHSEIEVITTGLEFASPDAQKVESLKDAYLRSKYLKRLKDNIADKEADI